LSQVDPGRPLTPFKELEAELMAFDPTLPAKPRLLALNKIDLLSPDFPRAEVIKAYQETGRRVFAVSALTGENLPALIQAIWEEVISLGHESAPAISD